MDEARRFSVNHLPFSHVLTKPLDNQAEKTPRVCVDCGHENYDLEPDEDGDYVCEECGAVIPEVDEDNEVRKTFCPDIMIAIRKR